MKLTAVFSLFLLISLSTDKLISQEPVTQNASPEVRSLLQFFQEISGSYILPGQHNFPKSGARNSEFAADYIGETPPVWSQDFGFAEEGDKDSYLSRPDIIAEAIRQHKKGSIITLCWHAVPPTADEPVTFQPQPGSDSTRLTSVQGNLLPGQFKDLLTPGTTIYNNWIEQVDEIAGYLRQLENAKVPVLWRPYHEMNGDWFWWGGIHEGDYTTKRLYQQIFDRLVNHHHLNNLLWVWSVDRPGQPGREFSKYYPGAEYLDFVSLDVYGGDFDQAYYDSLEVLADGKPMILGEVGTPPTLETLESQPNWSLWVIWSGMTRGTSKEQYQSYVESDRVVFKEDPIYAAKLDEFRRVAGLPSLIHTGPVEFTGVWQINEVASRNLPSGFGGTAPYKMHTILINDILAVWSADQVEWDDDRISKELIYLDGSDMQRTFFNSPMTKKAKWSEDKQELIIESEVTLHFGGNTFERKVSERWMLRREGKQLVIDRSTVTSRGTTESRIVYDASNP